MKIGTVKEDHLILRYQGRHFTLLNQSSDIDAYENCLTKPEQLDFSGQSMCRCMIIYNEILTHYKVYAPHLDNSTYKSPQETINEKMKITEDSVLFTNIIVKEYSRIQMYTSEEFIALLDTNSKHRQLPVKSCLIFR